MKLTLYLKYFILLSLLTILGVLCVKYTLIDFTISDYFWNKNEGWLVKERNLSFYIFYKFAKKVFIAFLIASFFIAKLSFFKKNFTIKKINISKVKFKILLFFSLSIFYIILVSYVKSISMTPCPKSCIRYAETYSGCRTAMIKNSKPQTLCYFYKPNKRFFDFNIKCERCKCFPGAHSTIGFSLIFLYFIFKNERRKKLSLILGVIFGNIFGLYQLARGEHYFFDNYFSMLIALWLLLMVKFIKDAIKVAVKKN